MAANFFAFCIICAIVPLYTSSVLPQRHRSSIKGILRSRREACPNGEYVKDDRKCCLCPPGQRVKEHCTPDSPNNGQCEHCESGTYNSVANFQETCQPCTSCNQPNANLEEAEPCTAAVNTKCRCKKDHFCSSKECTICHPCKTCGIGGIEKECAANSDRVCRGPDTAVTGIVLGVLIVVGVIAGVIWWRLGLPCKRQKNREEENQSGPHVEIPLLPDDFELLLPDISKELGWKDMKNVALRTGLGNPVIESCEMDNKNCAEERTLQLLTRWVEKEGKEAPRKLIQTLKKMDKKGKAEKISDILSNANSASSNNSGTNN